MAAAQDPAHVAAEGVAGAAETLPHAERIQASFGRHDISHIRAASGGQAAGACAELGASAYATRNHVAFAVRPDLHTAAHEAAHVVQQRAGVSLKGGVGQAGDPYEQHADLVADLVVQGKSAEAALDATPGGSGDGVQLSECDPDEAIVQDESNVCIDDQPAVPGSEGSGNGPLPNPGAAGAIAGMDAHIRVTQYVEPAKQLAEQAFSEYVSGQLGHMEAREQAATGRADALASTREKLSPGGKAMSAAIKEESPPLETLAKKYATRVLESDEAVRAEYGIKTLDEAAEGFDAAKVERAVGELMDSPRVSEEIIKAAGRPNAAMTKAAKAFRVLGPLATGADIAVSGYEVYNAEEGEHLWTAGRETTGFATGTLGAIGGGLLAGWTASLMCGPGAPVCAIAVSIVVVGIAASGAGLAGEAVWEAAVDRDAFTDEELLLAAMLGLAEEEIPGECVE